MDVEHQIAYWKEGAAEDFDVARTLLLDNRIRHALFFADLALEKMLKAHLVKLTGELPPRTHNLIRLADLAQIPLTEEQRKLLARFQEYCLAGRYPETLGETLNRADAEAELNACQRMLEWLTNRFE